MKSLRSLYLVVLFSLFSALPLFADEPANDVPADKSSFSLNIGSGGARGEHAIDWEGILIPFGIFVMIGTLVYLRGRARIQINQARMDTIKVLAEKGQPIPEGLLTAGTEPETSRHLPMGKAVRQLGVGIAFVLYFMQTDKHGGFWAIGVALIIIGLGNIWLAKKAKA